MPRGQPGWVGEKGCSWNWLMHKVFLVTWIFLPPCKHPLTVKPVDNLCICRYISCKGCFYYILIFSIWVLNLVWLYFAGIFIGGPLFRNIFYIREKHKIKDRRNKVPIRVMGVKTASAVRYKDMRKLPSNRINKKFLSLQFYCKVRQPFSSREMAIILQNYNSITKCDRYYYKRRQYTELSTTCHLQLY